VPSVSLWLFQNAYFNANCMIRGSSEFRICPKSAFVMSVSGSAVKWPETVHDEHKKAGVNVC
jgi:hypothetical protein